MMRLLNFSAKVNFAGNNGGYGACGTGFTLGGAGGSVSSAGVGDGIGSGAGVGSCTLGGAMIFLLIVTLRASWVVVTAGLGSRVGATVYVAVGYS